MATRTDTDILSDFDDIFREDTDPGKTMREMGWFLNILFYLGEQWISWFDGHGFGFRFKMNPFEAAPVSNLVREYVRSMKALIMNKRYAVRVWPNSTEQRDRDAAELGGLFLRHLDSVQCNEIEDVKEMVALWTIMTGNGFARTYASKNNGCYVKRPDGKVICRGDIEVDNFIPFNVHVPILGDTLRNKRCVGMKGLKDKEWVEDTFKIKIVSGDHTDHEIEYEKKLLTILSKVSPWKGRGLVQDDILTKENERLVMFKEMEYKPTERYPEGLYEVVVNRQVVSKKKRLPISVTREGDWEYTLTEFKYNYTPGSFWATGGVDDLISPQKVVNEVDKACGVNRKTFARPFLLTPVNLILKRLSLPGQEEFLSLQYDDRSAGGIKPEVVKGTPYPEQILKERQNHMESAQQAAGDPKNILRGQAPTSGASGVMVDILRESAELSHTPDIERFYRSWNRVKKKQLIIGQETYTESRTLKVTGEGNEIIIKSFKGADLYNNTDVRLEIDSGMSTTRAGQNELIRNLVQNNFFGPIHENPKLQYELLKKLGMSWVPISTSVHEERSRREHSMISGATVDDIQVEFDQKSKPVPLLDDLFYALYDEDLNEVKVWSHDKFFKLDDHGVHFEEHTKYILSKEFQSLPVANQTLLINHNDMHNYAIKAQQQQVMQQAMQAEAIKLKTAQDVKPPTDQAQPTPVAEPGLPV